MFRHFLQQFFIAIRLVLRLWLWKLCLIRKLTYCEKWNISASILYISFSPFSFGPSHLPTSPYHGGKEMESDWEKGKGLRWDDGTSEVLLTKWNIFYEKTRSKEMKISRLVTTKMCAEFPSSFPSPISLCSGVAVGSLSNPFHYTVGSERAKEKGSLFPFEKVSPLFFSFEKLKTFSFFH